MKTINLTEVAIAEQMGRSELTSYMYDVVENGHRPGVLSGANLKGKAKQYSASYAITRASVIDAMAEATDGAVRPRKVLINSRWARVWVDTRINEPVSIAITEEETA